MKLVIKSGFGVNGHLLGLRVEEEDSILRIKEKFSQKMEWDLKMNEFFLWYNGTKLEDSKLLSEYSIPHYSTVLYYVKLNLSNKKD